MNLHVDVYGYAGADGSGAPLLLIHGWGMHGGMWKNVAEQLAQHFYVLAVDLPGHGHSVARDSSRHSGDDGIDAIVDKLSAQFTEPLTLCGWSLGGQIALRWAQRQPQQVQRLLLVATTPCFMQRPDWLCAMQAETLAEFDTALRENYAQTLRRFLALQVRGGEQERELLSTLRSALFSRGEPDLTALQSGLEILRECDLRAVLPDVKQDTLVIAGERDTLTPLLAAQYMAYHLPNAQLAEIKGAAHAPFLSHPEEFLKHVVNFVSGHG